MTVELDPDRLMAYRMGISEVRRAVAMSNVANPSISRARLNREFRVAVDPQLISSAQVGDLVIRVVDERPVFLKDVSTIADGPDEVQD